jgi:hypothetical protein
MQLKKLADRQIRPANKVGMRFRAAHCPNGERVGENVWMIITSNRRRRNGQGEGLS